MDDPAFFRYFFHYFPAPMCSCDTPVVMIAGCTDATMYGNYWKQPALFNNRPYFEQESGAHVVFWSNTYWALAPETNKPPQSKCSDDKTAPWFVAKPWDGSCGHMNLTCSCRIYTHVQGALTASFCFVSFFAFRLFFPYCGMHYHPHPSIHNAAKIDCIGQWTDGTCSRSCDQGTLTQTFIVSTAAGNGGANCSYANGATRTATCNLGACRTCLFATQMRVMWNRCGSGFSGLRVAFGCGRNRWEAL